LLVSQGFGDNLLDDHVGDREGRTGTRFVVQPFEAVGQEALPPFADGHRVDAEPCGDLFVVQALSAGQDDPGTCGEPQGAFGPIRPGFELLPLVVTQGQRGFGATTFAHDKSHYTRLYNE
jgi:hypothetical protein